MHLKLLAHHRNEPLKLTELMRTEPFYRVM